MIPHLSDFPGKDKAPDLLMEIEFEAISLIKDYILVAAKSPQSKTADPQRTLWGIELHHQLKTSRRRRKEHWIDANPQKKPNTNLLHLKRSLCYI